MRTSECERMAASFGWQQRWRNAVVEATPHRGRLIGNQADWKQIASIQLCLE